MKKIYSLLLLGGLLLLGVGNVTATDIRGGGYLYVRNLNNAGISGIWKSNSSYMRVYVFGESGSQWLDPTNDSPIVGVDGNEGAVYKYEIPDGSWSTIILTRGGVEGYNFDNKWNQTGNISLPENGNLLAAYSADNSSATWTNYDASSTATNWYLNSASSEWASVQFMKANADATTASATVAVSSLDESLEFYIQSAASGVTLKNNGTMTPTSNGPWTFNTSDNNAHFKSTIAGNYTFTLNLSTNEVTIAYPTAYTRSDITAANIWGTICLPVDGTISNATLYSILGTFGGNLYLSAVGTELTAGMPYIFKSSASTPSVVLANTAYEATPLSESDEDPHPANGLYGRYKDQSFSTWNTSTIYVVRDAEIQKASTSSGVMANRAFIQMLKVPTLSSAPAAPGVRELPMAPENATDINAIEASENAVKFIENGKLLIRKEGVVYDMTGRVIR